MLFASAQWPMRSTRAGVWMSFRARLTSFFVVIVVLPMVAVGFLVFRPIGQSEQGKAGARANGLAGPRRAFREHR
jgi:hypothetical protein